MTSAAFPPQAQNNLFLNSESRAVLNLPTFADKSELQKNYYYQLLARAKKTVVTYPSGEDVTPSPFISEMVSKAAGWLENEKPFSPSMLLSFPRKGKSAAERDLTIAKTPERLEILRFFKYSPTALDTFRRCERRFFYRYIAKLIPPKTSVDKINMGELGNILHYTMKELFLRGFSPLSPEYPIQLCKIYEERIAGYDYFTKDPVGAFYARNLRASLIKIAESDRIHSEAGGLIRQRFEEWVEADYGGVSVGGYPDRWDENRDGVYLVDYKFRSKLPNVAVSGASFDNPETDIQLPLYALILERKFGKPPVKLFWFDLKNKQNFVEGFNMDIYDDFKEYFLTLVNKILSPGIFEIPEKVNCEHCNYCAMCPGCKK
jgi:RecB family exonuclease